MTLLGKIFTVLILIMSVLFMGFSIVVYATHSNWKEIVDNATATPEKPLGLKQQLEIQLERNRQLIERRDALVDQYAMEQAARRFALAGLQAKLDEALRTLTEQERVLQNLTATENTTASALEVAQQTLSDLTDEVGRVRGEIKTVRQDRDFQFHEAVRLTDENNQAKRMQKELQDRQAPLLRERAGLKAVIAQLGVRFDVAADGTVRSDVMKLPPVVFGEVTAINEKNLVEISIGSDDGLLIGHSLDVYRQNAYLGRVIVRRTEPDKAVAEIIPEYRRGSIRKGDRVATKLS